MAAGLLPDPAAIGSTDDIFTWLRTLVHSVWEDPICGDGVCETPFEYAQYGRFGCRADCGRLQDLQNLTAVQIDLYWDFSHPAGSIPATVWHALAPVPPLPAPAGASHVVKLQESMAARFPGS